MLYLFCERSDNLFIWFFRNDSVASVFMALSALFMTTPRFFFVQMCVLLALIPLFYYNGQRGGESHPALNKWFFYIFYPAHLFLLGFLKCWIF
ncbi:MAG TPA: hypothetical protein DHW78_03360 [Ruminococcaceae bacterium]|nr:hypothetical protein [Oscillospiraceae bacterium]HCC02527.1 hypothetical protein [Oscillospiraceae bacterium]HCM23352.1 hypothetical protein [Oscillospiraceae bacterium]